MKPDDHDLERREFLTSGLGIAASISLTNVGLFGAEQQKSREMDELIGRLKNLNSAPQLRKAVSKDDRDTRPTTLPNYPTNYNWGADRDVRKTFFSIVRSNNEELWDGLIRHSKDDSYAITMRVYDGPDAANFTVGDLCQIVARDRLILVPALNSDPEDKNPPDVPIDYQIKDIAAFRTERRSKSLAELQLELCELARTRVANVDGITNEVRNREEGRVAELIEVLVKTRKPIFYKLSWERFNFYDQEKSAEILEDYSWVTAPQ